MDPIAVAGLVVGAIGTVAAVVGAIAAIYAARYAKASPTKEDLERVELNTAESARQIEAVHGHLADQKKREALFDQAARISITVKASGFASDPLTLSFTLKDQRPILLRVDLINRLDTPTGSVDCIQIEPLTFSATIDPQTASSWFNEGDAHGNVNLRLLRIRATLEIEEVETSRSFSVTMSQNSQPRSQSSGWVPFFSIWGGC